MHGRGSEQICLLLDRALKEVAESTSPQSGIVGEGFVTGALFVECETTLFTVVKPQ